MNAMPTWTVMGGVAIVCAVFVIILLVVHLARRFRREQRGFPVVTPTDSYTRDDTHIRPSRS
jgi:hypothetical protein